jgi:hypothetical protein
VEVAVQRVMVNEEFWAAIEEIVRSPAITEAITHQSAGFADQMADEVGQRSRRADAWLERVAHRMLHPGPTKPKPADTGMP